MFCHWSDHTTRQLNQACQHGEGVTTGNLGAVWEKLTVPEARRWIKRGHSSEQMFKLYLFVSAEELFRQITFEKVYFS